MSILRRSTDTPFERDSASTLLPWIIAVMVFLSALSVTGALLLQDTLHGWSQGLSGTMTVQIPSASRGEPVSAVQVEQVASALRATAGINRVRVLPREEIADMVRPWLGESADNENLPLPYLIDVGLASGADVNMADLQARLNQLVRGTAIEDHQRWLRQLADLVQGSLFLTIAIVVVILLATVLTIIFSARTGLRVHARVIEVLHLIGASDRYIARQFERQAFWLGFRGGLVGAAAAALTMYALGGLAGRVGAFELPGTGLGAWEWGLFLVFPAAAALVARVTARVTALRTLAKMP